MEQMTIQIAIRYFDLILYKMHVMDQKVNCGELSSTLLRSKLPKFADFQNSGALATTSQSYDKLRSLKSSGLELVALT